MPRMNSSLSVTDKGDGVLVFSLNKPDTRNALSRTLLAELQGAIEQARSQCARGAASPLRGRVQVCVYVFRQL